MPNETVLAFLDPAGASLIGRRVQLNLTVTGTSCEAPERVVRPIESEALLSVFEGAQLAASVARLLGTFLS